MGNSLDYNVGDWCLTQSGLEDSVDYRGQYVPYDGHCPYNQVAEYTITRVRAHQSSCFNIL